MMYTIKIIFYCWEIEPAPEREPTEEAELEELAVDVEIVASEAVRGIFHLVKVHAIEVGYWRMLDGEAP